MENRTGWRLRNADSRLGFELFHDIQEEVVCLGLVLELQFDLIEEFKGAVKLVRARGSRAHHVLRTPSARAYCKRDCLHGTAVPDAYGQACSTWWSGAESQPVCGSEAWVQPTAEEGGDVEAAQCVAGGG